jgi:hypothetical protein
MWTLWSECWHRVGDTSRLEIACGAGITHYEKHVVVVVGNTASSLVRLPSVNREEEVSVCVMSVRGTVAARDFYGYC